MRALLFIFVFANFAHAEGKIHFRAFIDGSDKLHIRNGQICYEHLTYHFPGQQGEDRLPTTIDKTQWMPRWDGKKSLPFTLPNPLPVGVPLDLSIEAIAVRGLVAIHEHPSPANNFALTLLINDDTNRGGAWYEFVLHWKRIE